MPVALMLRAIGFLYQIISVMEILYRWFGPAGMFAGLVLAEYGYNPIRKAKPLMKISQ